MTQSIAEIPSWGSKLAELGSQRFTGELRIQVDTLWFWIGFANGAIVNAASPAQSDTATKIAVAMHVITEKQAARATAIMAADRRRDELDVIGELAKMSDLDRDTFEADVIVRRAARTFALTKGKLTVATVSTLKPTRFAIPVQAVIFTGARLHMPEDKLAAELREMGTYFKLVPDADVSGFSFTPHEEAVLESLRDGKSLDELASKHPIVKPRVLQAIAYALVCTSAAVAAAARPRISPLGYDGRRSGSVPAVTLPKEPTPEEMRAARRLATQPNVPNRDDPDEAE